MTAAAIWVCGAALGFPLGCAVALRWPVFAQGVVEGFSRPWRVFKELLK